MTKLAADNREQIFFSVALQPGAIWRISNISLQQSIIVVAAGL